ncbi:MAG TPA: ATP-dependent DNA helicase RecQ [Vitreimonas sp.]|nr:ATP-dependent DNA helicase RecQ [Vitreimonas sp.]
MSPHQVLKQYFGYDEFRPGQLEIIETIISGQDTLALMPTGGGKSLCFQVPGLVLGGTTIVVSPLISLMKDQVDTLNRKGARATYLNSSLSAPENQQRLATFINQGYDFVYVAPERLLNQKFIAASQQVKINLIAIDEAHCISQWGHDFRPEYYQIHEYVKKLVRRPVLAAFTATATKAVQDDIVHSLQLSIPRIFSQSFRRTNLKLTVVKCQNMLAKELYLLFLLTKFKGQTGVIYASTRKSTLAVSTFINQFFPGSAVAYHGGLDSETRASIQEAFLNNDYQLIVATNAFGMGVDKGDVRFVIHYQVPGNLENYYQEAGRGGRDGERAECYLLIHPSDANIHQQFIGALPHHPKHLQLLHHKLKSMLMFTQLDVCRTQFLLTYFGENTQLSNCGACDICLGETLRITVDQQQYWQLLLAFRLHYSKMMEITPTEVMPETVMYYLTLLQPTTQQAYAKIPGIGQGWLEKWYSPLTDFLNNHPL